MPLTHEDIRELKKELDDRYVLQSDCDTIQQKINSRFANDDKRIELLIHQQKINNWLTGAIASGIATLLVRIFVGG